jgi:hypothetical protein
MYLSMRTTMSKKIMIVAYLLIATVILNSSVVFAAGRNVTYIKLLKTNPANNQNIHLQFLWV